jgi:hypothetical protein
MQPQISARDTLRLAATLEGNLGRMLATRDGSTSRVGNQSPRFDFYTSPMLEKDGRGVFSSAMLSQHQHSKSLLFGGAGGTRTSQRFPVDASVEPGRLDYERLQVMRQIEREEWWSRYGTTGLTYESPRAMFQQEGEGRGPFEQKNQIANLYYPPGVLPPAQRPSPDGGTLAALGSSMRKKSSPYIDASSLSDPNPTDLCRRRTRGGVTEPFPVRCE